MMEHAELVAKAAEILRSAHHAVVLTGAGISTPSGVPDFRSKGSGLWNEEDPMKVASYTTFRQRPQVFFDWFRPLYRNLTDAQPNPAHIALAQLEEQGYIQAIITQNIDGLHQRAGSKNVFEVHGSAQQLECRYCERTYATMEFYQSFVKEAQIPHCPNCKNILKPAVVLFEEMLPQDVWADAQQHAEEADVFLVVGSSLVVGPANSLPLYALESNARLLINTLSKTYLDEQADVLLPYNVVDVIPYIVRALHESQ